MIKIQDCLKALRLFKSDPSLCLSSTLKNEINSAFKNAKTSQFDVIKSITLDIHQTVSRTKHIDYEIAKLKGTTHAQIKNLNYGIIGLSLMLFFGSVTLSIHPIFIGGVAIGAAFYSKIARQSTSQHNITIKLESLITENKLLTYKLANQINQLELELIKLSDEEIEKRVN
ncbi:unnamed protein product [Babesia microti strain RI]|uniref:Uncharacterized protein n=1 Tax=Babesia microti (strain RI) TaxID=1133968 RepID=A0A1N6LWY4_BABMR|nr:uncharacterized protein BMR1_01G02551 [Babesia microti strain RI]SIO73390.1 unnamed protein product [Babesia microti strain RI]|eukprot:XP_021337491.1 uncharacterized protein BMR1_01G02551 [Babesia microti strain RI]